MFMLMEYRIGTSRVVPHRFTCMYGQSSNQGRTGRLIPQNTSVNAKTKETNPTVFDVDLVLHSRSGSRKD